MLRKKWSLSVLALSGALLCCGLAEAQDVWAPPQINAGGLVVFGGIDAVYGDYDIFLNSKGKTTNLSNFFAGDVTDDFAPQINAGGQVAWLGEGEEGYSLYRYNKGVTSLITSNIDASIPFVMDAKGNLAWVGYADEFRQIFYNGVQITDNAYDTMDASLSLDLENGKLAWVGYTSGAQDQTDVYFYDGKTVTNISKTPTLYEYALEINTAGQVAWLSYNEAGADSLYLYKTAKPGPVLIKSTAGPGIYINSFDLNNKGLLAWDEYAFDADTAAIWYYSGKAAPIQVSTNNEEYNFSPQINDAGQIAWLANTGGDYHALYFSTKGGLGQPVPQGGNVDRPYFSLNSKGLLAWEGYDNTEGAAGGDTDIFLFDGKQTTKNLFNNDYHEYLPTVNDKGLVAWADFDATSGTSSTYLYDGKSAVANLTYGIYDWNSRYPGLVFWAAEDVETGVYQLFMWKNYEVTQIANDVVFFGDMEYTDGNPYLVNDLGQVLYLEEDGDLRLYNAANGVTTLIANAFDRSIDTAFLDLNNAGQVAWVEWDYATVTYREDGDTWEEEIEFQNIYLYSKGKISQTTKNKGQFEIEVYGIDLADSGAIAYVLYESFYDKYGDPIWEGVNLYLGGKNVTNRGFDEFWAVELNSSGQLAFLGGRYDEGSEEYVTDVYLYSKGKLANLTNNPEYEYGLALNNAGQVAFLADDWDLEEVVVRVCSGGKFTELGTFIYDYPDMAWLTLTDTGFLLWGDYETGFSLGNVNAGPIMDYASAWTAPQINNSGRYAWADYDNGQIFLGISSDYRPIADFAEGWSYGVSLNRAGQLAWSGLDLDTENSDLWFYSGGVIRNLTNDELGEEYIKTIF